MRRRFQQRQLDCSFAVLDHLSTIAENLLTEFDVESIIALLQRTKNINASGSSSTSSTPNISPSTSVVLVDNNSTPVTPSSSMVIVDKDAGKMIESVNNKDSGENQHSDNSSRSSGQDSDEQSPTSTSHPASNQMKSKVECWNEVKYKTIYLETFLTLVLTIQLNLLGRYNYLYSVVALTERDREQIIQIQPSTGSLLNSKTEQKYLTFIWWFLNVGSKKAIERVREAVESVMSGIQLKQEISYKDFIWFLSEIRTKVESFENENGNRTHGFSNILMPEKYEDELMVLSKGGGGVLETFIEPELRNLLDETKDFIYSQDFATVLSSCLNSAFGLLSQDLYPHFIVKKEDDEVEETIEKNVLLIKLLPDVARSTNIILHGIPNKYIE
ncbi:16158_t:CDS:2, partial [Acaulospora morrowiae]